MTLSGFIDNPITRFLTSIAIGVVIIGILLALLPVLAFPVYAYEATSMLFHTLWQWNFIFPVALFFYGITTMLFLELTFLIVYGALFVWRMLNSARTV